MSHAAPPDPSSTPPASAPRPLRVLVTGAFGGIGRHVVPLLASRGHRVTALDLPAPRARRLAARHPAVELLWGDLRDARLVERAVQGQDAVVHLAFLLPPMSERAGGRAVNVEASRALIGALEARGPSARFLFASSYAVFGETRHLDGLLTVDSPVAPMNEYNRHKLEVEAALAASRLASCSLRFSAVLSPEVVLEGGKIEPLIFDLPADARQEFLHGEDAARAVAACLERDDVWGRTLLIGGGPSCQLRYLELVNRQLEALGLGGLPAAAFSREARQGGGWLDTRESQALLDYQRWSFEAYLADLRARAGYRRWLARSIAPLARWYILRKSPYLEGGQGC